MPDLGAFFVLRSVKSKVNSENIAFSFQRGSSTNFSIWFIHFHLKPCKTEKLPAEPLLIYPFWPNVQKMFGKSRKHFLNVFCTFIWIFGGCFCIPKDTAFCLRISFSILPFLGVWAFIKGWKTTPLSHVSLRETCFFPVLLLLTIGISLINLVSTHN